MSTLTADGPITGTEISMEQAKSPADFAKEAALDLVVTDTERTDSWLASNQWSLRWKEADILYQSPQFLSAWEGTTGVTKANVTRFTVAKQVNSVVPQLVSGIFYEDPPFVLRPRPSTPYEVIRGKTALFAAQLEEMKFYKNVKAGFRSCATFGTAIYKWGWSTEFKKVKKYVRKRDSEKVEMPVGEPAVLHTTESDEFEVKYIDQRLDNPFFDNIDLRHVLVDPGCRTPDIRDAAFVVHRMYWNWSDLDKLRDVEGYDIPSATALRDLFDAPHEMPASPGTVEMANQGEGGPLHHARPRFTANTIDPFEQPLEVLERWDNDKVIVVLNRKVVIRNEENPFGVIPFFSSNWWDIPDAFYGMGIGRIVGQDQRVEQGYTNAMLDILALAVNPQYIIFSGADIPTQSIRSRLGGILKSSVKVDEAMKLVEQPRVPAELITALQMSAAASESATGADQMLSQGNTTGGRTSMGRTAGGAGILASAVASRLQDPVENFVQNVFEPWLAKMDELNNERLPMQTLRDILGEELGQEYKLTPDQEEEFLNASLKFEVLAGAHLAAKRTMSQALPLMIQLFENPSMLEQLNKLGYTIDIQNLFLMIMEVSEWKNTRDVVRKMTDDEKQSYQQATQQAPLAKVQGAMALEQQKSSNKAQLHDQDSTSRLASNIIEKSLERSEGEVLRSTMSKAEGAQAVTGEPGNVGFGSE